VAENNLSLSMTVRYQARWVTFQTRAIARAGQIMWVEMPKTDHLPGNYKFKVGEQIGVTFSVARRKYVFATEAMGTEKYRLDPEHESTALRLVVPEQMQKVERRLHDRLSLSHDVVTRATFWLGGWEARPAEASVNAPIWSGQIINISAGGLLVRTTYEAAKYVETGDIVGVHVLLGGDEEDSVFVDAQIRHCARDGEMALIGMQFVENENIPEMSAGIEHIRRLIAEQKKRRQQEAKAD
ncbi:MAG: PilZ domain-containing protein, partial [Planctomycetes bacterium]|nr:PilZ domain-containing protein [Planctomycetota bacterium]